MNKGHNKCTVLQGVFKRESPQKLTKPGKAQPHQEAEKLENNCHIPDWVQAFSKENGGLNLVLRCIKPPTCMTVVYVSATFIKKGGSNQHNKNDKLGKIQYFHAMLQGSVSGQACCGNKYHYKLLETSIITVSSAIG